MNDEKNTISDKFEGNGITLFLSPLWVREWTNMGSGTPPFHKKDIPKQIPRENSKTEQS